MTQAPREQSIGRALGLLYGVANAWVPLYVVLASDPEVHAKWPLVVIAACLTVGLLQRFVVVWFAALILQVALIVTTVHNVLNGDPVGLRDEGLVAFAVLPLFVLVMPPLVRYVWKLDVRMTELEVREPISPVSPVTGDTIVYGAIHALAGCIFTAAIVLDGSAGAGFAMLLPVGILSLNVDALRGVRRGLQLSVAQAIPLASGTPKDSLASRVAGAFLLRHGSRKGRLNVWFFRLICLSLPILFPEMSPWVAGALLGLGARAVYVGLLLRSLERATGRRFLNEREPADPKSAPLYYVTSG